MCRTTPFISDSLVKLEELIQTKLIPALLGRNVTENMRAVFTLPARLGGLGLLNPVEEAPHEYRNSKTITAQLAEAIFQQRGEWHIDEQAQDAAIKEVTDRKAERVEAQKEDLKQNLSADLLKIVNLCRKRCFFMVNFASSQGLWI